MKPKKNIDMTITGLGFNIVDYTDNGLPSVDHDVLVKLAGDNKSNGYFYIHIFEDIVYYQNSNL